MKLSLLEEKLPTASAEFENACVWDRSHYLPSVPDWRAAVTAGVP